MAAIFNAREVATDPKWLTWADHWIACRDRSFESAFAAHQQAHEAREHELASGVAASDETAAELALWAAGLALVTAPVAPNITGACLRFEAALREKLPKLPAACLMVLARLSLSPAVVNFMRRLAAMFSASQVPAAHTVRP